MDKKELLERNMTDISGLRDFIFKHFELHANQRINLFRFYSAFIVLYMYGIGYIANHLQNENYHEEAAGIIVSILFILITYIFKKLDQRNHDILNNSRKAICYLEKKYQYAFIPEIDLINIQVFNCDKQQKEGCVQIVTHTQCFNLIFNVGYGLSLLVVCICLLRMGAYHFLCELANSARHFK